MAKRPPSTHAIFGVTRAMLARLGRLSPEDAEKLPLPDVERSLRLISRRITAQGQPRWWSQPCRNPTSKRKPPIAAYYANYTLLYSPDRADQSEVSTSPPTAHELEHTARQLCAFGTRAQVVGRHILVGRDLLSLYDARRLLPLCEAYDKPASRRLFLRALHAIGLRNSSRGRSRRARSA